MRSRSWRGFLYARSSVVALVLISVALGSAATVSATLPGSMRRASLSNSGAEVSSECLDACVDAQGRFVAFVSPSPVLVPGDTNPWMDIFLRDMEMGTTALMSKLGSSANASSQTPAISMDGRVIAFESYATNLVSPPLPDFMRHVYVKDTRLGGLTLVSVTPDGVPGNAESTSPRLNGDGTRVVFESLASDLVDGDANGVRDVYVRDLVDQTTVLISRASDGSQGELASFANSISQDGNRVVFHTSSPLEEASDNHADDVYVRDLETSTTILVSVAADGGGGNGHSRFGSLSADGRYVAFQSTADNLVPDDDNAMMDVFVRDLVTGETTLVSRADDGTLGNNISQGPQISADGRYVAFHSIATNFADGDTGTDLDVFVHDTRTGTTKRVSIGMYLSEPTQGCALDGVSGDGRVTVFETAATNIIEDDSNGTIDVFVWTDNDFAPTITSDAVSEYTAAADVELTVADDYGTPTIAYTLDDGTRHQVEAYHTTVTTSLPGEHSLTFSATDAYGQESDSQTVTFTVEPGALQVVRVAGTDRYATAVEASKRAYPGGAPAVVIATGANWPDALGGSALAGAVGGPLLLTQSTTLPSSVVAEIERLRATKAYILGGTGAVSAAVEDKLVDTLGDANVTRLAGDDRYGTAAVVADTVIDMLGAEYDGTAFVATGGNYPDALAGSPISAAMRWPILLASPATGSVYLPPTTDDVFVLGGTGAVSTATEAKLVDELGEEHVTRLGGLTRYATAALVAEEGVARGLHWHGVGIATGESFPDALSGGAMLGAARTVMLLTPGTSLASDSRSALAENADMIGLVHIIGGTGAVSDAVVDQVRTALGD